MALRSNFQPYSFFSLTVMNHKPQKNKGRLWIAMTWQGSLNMVLVLVLLFLESRRCGVATAAFWDAVFPAVITQQSQGTYHFR